ncbi:MAG: hypothetical protein CR986_05225 [Ignavibacteriae bacterium]|nr:MAG: hypothetical protein CR986_05225 [Ignavibacteriota bacterium]
MFEYFISKRYLRSKHRLSIISIISVISTLGVTIGVAALVIVLSVFNGFSSLVTNMLVNFDPHIRLTFNKIDTKEIVEIKKFLNENSSVSSYSEYSEGKSIVLKNKAMEILNLKGISEDSQASLERINSRIKFGGMDISSQNSIGKIIISLPIALRLSARVGDTLFVTSAEQIKKIVTRMSIPKTLRVVVSGIYEINNKEYSMSYCFTSLKTAQALLNRKNKISGLEIVLHDINNSEKFKKEFTEHFNLENIKANSWYDLHKDLYRVMLLERWAAYILLSLIIAVAAFNILSSLTMSVIEKKKDIGILRSMGANSNSIKRIFMFEGVLIGFIGTIFGLILGLLVCYMQINFNIYSLDASKYVIDTLPMQVKFSDIIAVTLMSMLLTFFASRYPAKRALKTKVINAIKWE